MANVDTPQFLLRPEHRAPPQLFFDSAEAQEYAANTRVRFVQKHLAICVVRQLLCERLWDKTKEPGFYLDIGSGALSLNESF